MVYLVTAIEGYTGVALDKNGFACGILRGRPWWSSQPLADYYLEAGDHLTVWEEDGSILFAGIVIPTPSETGWIEMKTRWPIGVSLSYSSSGEDFLSHWMYFPHGQLGYTGWNWLFVHPSAIRQPGILSQDQGSPATTTLDGVSADSEAPDRKLRARLIRSPLLRAAFAPVSAAYLHPLPPARNTFAVGTTDGFFETGTEGVWWTVYRRGATGYEGLVDLHAGDLVAIWTPKGTILFVGMIIRDFSEGWYPPRNQPAALNLMIHWTQWGFSADNWAKLFFTSKVLEDGRSVMVDDANNYAVVLSVAPLRCLGTLIERRINRKGPGSIH